MRQITVNLYTFEELNNDAKEKAREWWRSGCFDSHVDYEPIYEGIIEKTAEYGMDINEDNISWSGFWCQGDGASFTCEDIDIRTVCEKLGITFKHGLNELFFDTTSASINRISHHYSHKYTVEVNVTAAEWVHWGEYKHITAYLEKKGEELEKKLTELKNRLCDKLYKDLEEEYEFQTSDAEVNEALIANGYEFYEDGKVA